MLIEEIYNYRKVNDQALTGGQPTERQLQALAAAGVQAVINLATPQSDNALPDEAGLVRALGMAYYAIPVDWENPTRADFEAFTKLLQNLGAAKVLIHCAANYRVTAFYSLYAQKHLGWSVEQAEQFRLSVWQGSHYPVWEQFIQDLRQD